MLELLVIVRALALARRGHRELVLENLALRQQLTALRRTTKRAHLPILAGSRFRSPGHLVTIDGVDPGLPEDYRRLLPPVGPSLLASLAPVSRWAESQGFTADAEHVLVPRCPAGVQCAGHR